MPRGYYDPLTDEERETIKKMLLDGMSVTKISGLVGRSIPTVQNIKKELGLVQKDALKKANESLWKLCQKWDWEDPREKKQKQEPRKRDWWAKKTNSHFRTPYHYPGKTNY